MSVSFDGKVVLVTGASRGLGNAFARCLAEAGATVAVNSTGKDDGGAKAVQAIIDAGGDAFDLPGGAEDGAVLVNQVVERCGRIDAIVHNAGFVRDKTLAKMTSEQWDQVMDVHIKAAFLLTQAAWPHFVEQGGGRVVFLSSSAGLYGNFGQANYASAKMGMYGLARSIELEGANFNIKANCVAPFGATELNSANFPEEMKAAIKTEYVAPLVAWLAHPDCEESGGMFEASAGVFKKVRWQRTVGLTVDPAELSIDSVAEGWDKIVDFSEAEYPKDMREALGLMYADKVKS